MNREFETNRSPISHKLLRTSKDPQEKSGPAVSGKRPSNTASDDDNTGTSFRDRFYKTLLRPKTLG
jgi:hypothetical protein